MNRSRSLQIVSFRSRSLALATFAVLLTLFFAALPAAGQSSGSSSAYGESVNVAVAPLLGTPLSLKSGPVPGVSGSSPAAYDTSYNAAQAAVSTPVLGQVLGSQVVTVHASGSLPTTSQSFAEATVDNLSLQLAGLLPLLTATAGPIHSSATLTNACAVTPTAVGSASFTNLRLGGTLGLGITVPSNLAANTVLLSLLGIQVVANEQIVTTSGGTTTLTVNALHASVNSLSVMGLGLLTADVVVAQSKASLTCGIPQADLAVTAVADAQIVRVGQPLTYTLDVTNDGPATAVASTLVDQLPTTIDFVSAQTTQGSCVTGQAVLCNLGDIAPGVHVVVTVVVVTDDPGDLVNGAIVATKAPEANLADNQASVTTRVDPQVAEIAAHPRR